MSAVIPTLERGKACVECRRRKQRCDGTLPKCSVCIRAGRPCRYEVPVRRPVSVVLEERLGRLETRLRNLMPASPKKTNVNENVINEPTTAIETPDRLSGPIFTNIIVPSQMSGRWWEAATLNPAIHDYLLQIFLRYQGRIYFNFHLPTLLDRMASPNPEDQPHPCLLNAIYLMACFFSSLEFSQANSLSGQEDHFLARTQAALTESLSLSDRLLDFLRGSSLVATYLFMRGRHLEGYHVHCGTARFSLSCGLNRVTSHEVGAPMLNPPVTSLLPNPETQLEIGERLMTFWNIYWLDKIYSLLLAFVPALPSEDERVDTVQSIFPRDLSEYAVGNVRDGDTDTISDLLLPYDEGMLDISARRPETGFTMVLKATTLLSRARRLRQAHTTRMSRFRSETAIDLGSYDYYYSEADATDTTIAGLKLLHLATDRFAATLPAVTDTEGELTPYQLSVLAARTITLGALIEINNVNADTDPQAHATLVTSAGYIAALASHFRDGDLDKACLTTGYAWCLAAQVLIDLSYRSQALVPGTSSDEAVTEYERQLAKILTALERIAAIFPVLAEFCALTPKTETISI